MDKITKEIQSSQEDVRIKDKLPEDFLYQETLKRQAEIEKQAESLSSQEFIIEAKIVEELNKSLAIVHTSSTYILIEKGSDFVLDSKTSLLALYENQPVPELSGKDGKKVITKAHVWLKSPYRRTFNNIVFNPKIAGHYEGNFNIWRGFAVQPKQGDCSHFWDHVRVIICSENVDSYQYVRKWLAHLIQRPWMIATALVLQGKQGTGKGTFVSAIGKLLGAHYAPLASLDQILGRFNSHLKNMLLVYADEAIWGGNRKEVGILKALITEPRCFVEAKGRDGYWIDNCKHLIASSNEDWIVHLDPDDRRFFVLNVSDSHKEDISYFKAIDHELENGGYGALLYDLFHEDLTGFDPRIMPENPAGFDMKMASATSIDRFIYASLKLGSWDHTNVVPLDRLESLTMEILYKRYKEWCERERQEIKQSSLVGKRLHAIFEGLDITRTSRSENPSRPPRYIFPPLVECRNSFEKFYKQTHVIWEWS